MMQLTPLSQTVLRFAPHDYDHTAYLACQMGPLLHLDNFSACWRQKTLPYLMHGGSAARF